MAMRTVNIHESRTHLSRLVDAAAKGESFVIARAGKPVVKVVPLEEAPKKPVRRLGFITGQTSVPDDFDAMGQGETIRMFEGEFHP